MTGFNAAFDNSTKTQFPNGGIVGHFTFDSQITLLLGLKKPDAGFFSVRLDFISNANISL